MNKQDFIERLRNHPLYKAALKSVDPAQARRISSIAEGFLGEAIEGLVPMIVQATDPNQINEARRIVNEQNGVVTDLELNASGSIRN